MEGKLCIMDAYFDTDKSDGSISEEEIWIASLLLRHLQLVQFNAHEIHEFIQVDPQTMRNTKTEYLGVGIYPTASYFNHSCQPSVTRYV